MPSRIEGMCVFYDPNRRICSWRTLGTNTTTPSLAQPISGTAENQCVTGQFMPEIIARAQKNCNQYQPLKVPSAKL